MPDAGLIDRFLSRADADVSESCEIVVSAPADVTFEAAESFDLGSIPLVRAIFWLRARLLGSAAPAPRWPEGLVAETAAIGWGALARRPSREIVMGAVTRPWLADVTFRAVPPEEFAGFAEPDFVRIAWTIEAEPLGDVRTRLRTQTRARGTDASARRKFRRYWRKFGIGILLIRRLALPAIRREAERRYREVTEDRGATTAGRSR